jgi:hypothetical protein
MYQVQLESKIIQSDNLTGVTWCDEMEVPQFCHFAYLSERHAALDLYFYVFN